MRNLLYFCLLASLVTSCSSGEKGPTTEERKAAQNQKYVDQLAVEQKTLHVTDSLIQTIIPRINEVTSKSFDYEKSKYDDLGHFVPKGMSTDENVQRTYIRCAVDEYGQTAGLIAMEDILEEIGTELAEKIDELEQSIYSESGTKFNINSPKQLGKVLFEDMALPYPKPSTVHPKAITLSRD